MLVLVFIVVQSMSCWENKTISTIEAKGTMKSLDSLLNTEALIKINIETYNKFDFNILSNYVKILFIGKVKDEYNIASENFKNVYAIQVNDKLTVSEDVLVEYIFPPGGNVKNHQILW